jgi:ADP-ribose pyrophosphatase
MTIPTLKVIPENDIKIIEKKTVYQGFFRVVHYLAQHRLFAGGWSQTIEREVMDKRGAAAGLLYDPNEDKVVLIEQFRIGALADPESPWLLELVAGVLELDEEPEALVVRETAEEAGLEVTDLHFICQYWVSPGISTEQVTLFCAKVDSTKAGGIHGLPEEGEDIRVTVVTPEQAYEALEKGQLKNAPTIIGLQWLRVNKKMLQAKWGC